MPQEKAWDKEYKERKLVSGNNVPQSDFVDFIHWLRRKQHIEIDGLRVIDLGSGVGKNAFYLAERGSHVDMLEISKEALVLSKEILQKDFSESETKLVTFLHQSIGETFPFQSNIFDLAIDVTSSNSLYENERKMYLKETHRVLKDKGYFFVRALLKDGDQNAKNLIKKFPGAEVDTYILPGVGITERVWTEKDFKEYYGAHFEIVEIIKNENYARMTIEGKQQKFKRRYLVAYMIKK